MANTLQEQALEAIQYLDNQKAWEILVQAAKQGGGLQRKEYLSLSYLRMNSLTVEQALAILQESLLVAFTIPDFNLEQKITDYVELLDYVPDQVAFIKGLKTGLEQHQETLGKQKITLGQTEALPTIGSWIADFNAVAGRDRFSALGEMRYINTGANPKLLSGPEREALRQIVRIYIRVSEYSDFWDRLPEDVPEEQLSEFVTYVNGIVETTQSEEEAKTTQAEPGFSSIPPTSQVGEPIPEAGIFSEQVDSGQAQSAAPVPPARPSAEQRKIMQDIAARAPKDVRYGSDGASIRNLINQKPNEPRGIVLTRETNIKVEDEQKRLADDREQKATDIQSKLEELKKRKT